MFTKISKSLFLRKGNETSIRNIDEVSLMHVKNNNTISLIRIKNIKTWIFFILAAVFLFLGTTEAKASYLKWDSLYGEHEDEEIGSPVRNNIISFENDKVEAGVTLKVLGAPEGAAYNWTIASANGTESTFTTTDNFYTPADTDLEKLITVTVEGLEGAEAAIYFGTLPVVYINNSTGYYAVNDEYTNAVMSMQGNEKYSNSDEFYNGDIEIKLRGNSTRYREKRPFNIKLDTKADLLGMGENKRWALLANDIDHTLMRNKLLYDFSGAIGMDTFMKSENIIVIFNNQYYGVYQLCELVNLGSERVNIYDWEESAGDAANAIVGKLEEKEELSKEDAKKAKNDLEDAMCMDLSWITSPYAFSYDINKDGTAETYIITDYIELPEATGGALVEMDPGVYNGLCTSAMITAYTQPLTFKSPEYAITNNTLFDYTQKYLQAFEYALHSSDYIYHESDKKYKYLNRFVGVEIPRYEENVFNVPEYEGKHYSELFDMDSLVQNFLVCEFSMNVDSMHSSLFMYKDIDGLFHMGPEWDFDWAWGNINMFNFDTGYPTIWHTTGDEVVFDTVQWNKSLIRDPYFIIQVYQKYKDIRESVLEDMIKSGGTIDSYDEYLKNSAAANDAKWEYTYAQYKSVGFDKSMENMRSFINTRLEWMDAQFESPDTLIASLGYYIPNAELMVAKVDIDTVEEYAEVTAVVSGSAISNIAFQVNGTHMYSAEVINGQAVCQIPVTDLVSEENQLNVIQILAKNAADEYIIDAMEEGNYNDAKSNYAVFYSKEGFVNAEAVKIIDKLEETALQEGKSSQKDAASQEVSAQKSDQSGSHTILIILIIVIGLALVGLAAVIILKTRKRKLS